MPIIAVILVVFVVLRCAGQSAWLSLFVSLLCGLFVGVIQSATSSGVKPRDHR